MRPLLAVPVLLLVLAGCAAPPSSDPADAPAAIDPDAPYVPPSQEGGLQPRMRFAAAEFEQTANYPGSFPISSTCTPFTPCDEQVERIDLTPQVPADAPVELTAIVTATDSVHAAIEVDGGSVQRYTAKAGSDRAEVAATLIRQPSGTVTLVVQHGNLFVVDPTASSVPFDAEVRTAVRPDTLPAYLPVFIALRPGDRIQAMGADSGDIDDFMVIPPGMDPIHQTDNLTFVVTDAMPAGDYVAMVMGAQAMLHGPNATLRAAPIEWVQGEDRAITSGQPLTWTAAIPGIPAYAMLFLATGAGTDFTSPEPSYHGGFTMAIRQQGVELAAEENPSCIVPCSFNGAGQSTRMIGTSLFPEGLRLGDLEFEVTNDMSQGMRAYEVIGYIATDA